MLRETGCTSKLRTCLIRDRAYGINLEDFPPALKQEVLDLLAWKTKEYAPGRSKKARIRPVTARNLKGFICRL